MHLRCKVQLGGATLLLVLSGCGSLKPRSFDEMSIRREPVVGNQVRTTFANPLSVADTALSKRALEEFAWSVSFHDEEQPRSHPVEPRPVTSLPAIHQGVTDDAGQICGGDLPPCYVAERESGMSYSAYNPTGCGGSGCYGKWQFSGAWAGKLGLPQDLSQATPEQQDEAARQLWAQGAGCSNWAAC